MQSCAVLQSANAELCSVSECKYKLCSFAEFKYKAVQHCRMQVQSYAVLQSASAVLQSASAVFQSASISCAVLQSSNTKLCSVAECKYKAVQCCRVQRSVAECKYRIVKVQFCRVLKYRAVQVKCYRVQVQSCEVLQSESAELNSVAECKYRAVQC